VTWLKKLIISVYEKPKTETECLIKNNLTGLKYNGRILNSKLELESNSIEILPGNYKFIYDSTPT